MGYKTKRRKAFEALVDRTKSYSLEEALELLKKSPTTKFDQTVELAARMGVDPRKADQNVRGTVTLPHGTGRKNVIVVLTQGDKIQQALDAGADFAGNEELVQKISAGWTDFNAVIATPDMMRVVGRLGKVLGPRGLMPTPKAGTVTNDVVKAIEELKGGKIEYKVDRHGVISAIVGKLSFDQSNLLENLSVLLQAIQRSKPASAKGQYFRSLAISSTMGPGLKIDSREIDSL